VRARTDLDPPEILLVASGPSGITSAVLLSFLPRWAAVAATSGGAAAGAAIAAAETPETPSSSALDPLGELEAPRCPSAPRFHLSVLCGCSHGVSPSLVASAVPRTDSSSRSVRLGVVVVLLRRLLLFLRLKLGFSSGEASSAAGASLHSEFALKRQAVGPRGKSLRTPSLACNLARAA